MYICLCVHIHPFIYLSTCLQGSFLVYPAAISTLSDAVTKEYEVWLWPCRLGNMSWLSIALLFLSFTSGDDQIPSGRRKRWDGGRNYRICALSFDVYVDMFIFSCVHNRAISFHWITSEQGFLVTWSEMGDYFLLFVENIVFYNKYMCWCRTS